MFGFRRHRRHSLLHFVLALLGIRFLARECKQRENLCEPMNREEYRTKMKSFRSKMREAFDVWKDAEPAAEAAPEHTEPEAQA